jgi:large subunit ribosomal protein L25
MKTAASKVYNLTANFRHVEGTRRCQELRATRNRIPGVVYGGVNEQHKILVHMSQFDVANLLNQRGASFNSTLIDLKVEDEYDPKGKESKTFRVVPRSIMLHHLHDFPTSCNWLIHDPEKGLRVELPIVIEDHDKCPGLKRGAVVSRVFWNLPCIVKGPTIPDAIKLSVAGLNIGNRLRWSDVKWGMFLPEGVSVECEMFRKEGLRRSNIKDLTLLTIEGGKKSADEEEKTEDAALEKF